MKIEPGQTIEMGGQSLVAREVFRASGATWVRYSVDDGRRYNLSWLDTDGKITSRSYPRNNESRYASREEWLDWFFQRQSRGRR